VVTSSMGGFEQTILAGRGKTCFATAPDHSGRQCHPFDQQSPKPVRFQSRNPRQSGPCWLPSASWSPNHPRRP